MGNRLEGKVALVTGAGSIGPGWGNGKATSVLFAREGARVFAVDLALAAAEETRRLIEAEGGLCRTHRADVILTNPPFGGEEEAGIRNNFPANLQTSATELLFLQLIMRRLRRPGPDTKPGRAGMVVPNGTLFGDGVCARIKEQLLKEFNLHTIVRLPNGVFSPYTSIPTNLLFFDRSGSTDEIWYYEIPLPEGRKNYTKTRPMQYEEFASCIAWWKDRQENDHAWRVRAEDVLKYDADGSLLSANLDLKNPNSAETLEHLPPEQLVDDILAKERRIIEIMHEIRSELAGAKEAAA